MIVKITPKRLLVVGWLLFFVGLILLVFLSHALVPTIIFFSASTVFVINIVWQLKNRGK